MKYNVSVMFVTGLSKRFIDIQNIRITNDSCYVLEKFKNDVINIPERSILYIHIVKIDCADA